jgi:cysteine desulfurase
MEANAKYLSCYNASSDSKAAAPVKKLISDVTNQILSHCDVSTATHTVIFTSGATESNCYILRACVKSYKKKLLETKRNEKPHIITNRAEHHSVLACLEDMEAMGDVQVTYLTPTVYGVVLPEDVEAAIKPNTCLISIMSGNNEVPCLNWMEAIGKVAHRFNKPLHTDAVQVFGKLKINMVKSKISALSASAHKFYGPKGVGLLIIDNDLIAGYHFTAEISGSQQKHLRGGTENIAGIAAMGAALKHTFTGREDKNLKLLNLRERLLTKLAAKYIMGDYLQYLDETAEHPPFELVSLGPPDSKSAYCLFNTVLLAIVKNKGVPFCNVKLKHFLDKKNIVVSIGSACLTDSPSASHVLNAIGAPPVIKRGVIRVSFGDHNTAGEVDEFIRQLSDGIAEQTEDLAERMHDKPAKSDKAKVDKAKVDKAKVDKAKVDKTAQTTIKKNKKSAIREIIDAY